MTVMIPIDDRYHNHHLSSVLITRCYRTKAYLVFTYYLFWVSYEYGGSGGSLAFLSKNLIGPFSSASGSEASSKNKAMRSDCYVSEYP